ncbi:hypothetical protein KM043_016656 [Ampulex compressa]|nr:hypothetical protein KM043_016656 [Ampulex compressa]
MHRKKPRSEDRSYRIHSKRRITLKIIIKGGKRTINLYKVLRTIQRLNRGPDYPAKPPSALRIDATPSNFKSSNGSAWERFPGYKIGKMQIGPIRAGPVKLQLRMVYVYAN